MSLSTAQIRKLKPRASRFSVGAGAGLALVVLPTGRKSWVYRYNLAGKRECVTLGHWPRVSLESARKRHNLYAEIVARGESASEHQRRERLRLGDAVSVREFGERWLAEVVTPARKEPKTVGRYLERDVYPALGQRMIARVSGEEVQRLIFARRDEGSPEAAAAIRHLLKRLFDYARVCGLVEGNPVDRTPLRYVTRHHSRERVLSEAELRQFFQVLASGRAPIKLVWAMELILLTLCRKSELLLCRWKDVDLGTRGPATWEVPAEQSKTGKPHIVYLSRQAEHLFQSLWNVNWSETLCGDTSFFVLPHADSATQPLGSSVLNKAIARVKWGIPHFTPHDLRRTASTILNEKGYNPDWIEKCMNHLPAGVRGVYNRAQYGDQRRRMLQEWADYLESLKS